MRPSPRRKPGGGCDGKPLIIADYSDNPGSGAYGDATGLLKAVLEADLQNVGFHAICDPEAALEAQAAGVGNRVTLGSAAKSIRPWAVAARDHRARGRDHRRNVSSPMVRWEAEPGAITV